MENCRHENTETNSYIINHYGIYTVVTVEQCLDCEEIIEETESNL